MKIICSNKKAFHDYLIDEKIEAGICLKGDEVKSVRSKHVSLTDAFATVHKGEIVLLNCYIAPYSHAYEKQDHSRDSRKLLLKKKEINKLIGTISKKGITLVPTKMYLNDRGYVKVEIALARHKKTVDKKDALRERDIKRETARATKYRIV